MARFISEEVIVQQDSEGSFVAFQWRNQIYRIIEVLSDYRRVDFKSRWWLRRHQRRLVIRTDEGRFFELYAERRGLWILYRELDDPFQG
ncbi:MAG: hypothetical protein M1294_01705 [Firmicutes bacterium]|jgi:hypothetical protein|uniref:DUF6504 domain-containing protein n=1 Tax=Sulfobacillus benefaciens TaxID=453960 RepID=A0A2T2WY07_9FIRM|nr:hypothetical protein [Bacillota bacterium]MCL5015325.1 hypothetical protein [Bacillota bacterium]PSR27114.1 MAG: hypothetical protein C7B43_12350 [Sulfobacillus benefaciens]HBQ93696.1 hypothetical protein [Sulfobacillus sp.]